MKPRIPNHVHDANDSNSVSAGPNEASPIGTGVQAFLVICGIALFAGGLALSFGSFGIADFVGGDNDDIDTDDDVPPPDDGGTDEQDDTGGDDPSNGADGDDAGGTDDTDDADNGDDSDDGTAYSPPVLETEGTADVDESSAVLEGAVADMGDEDQLNVYFEWRTAGSDEWNVTEGEVLSSESSYSQGVSGLSDGTEYEFRAVGESGNGETVEGDINTFTTDVDDEGVEVETDGASDVDVDEATLHGELVDMGSHDAGVVYFEWRIAGSDSWNEGGQQTMFSTGSFEANIDNLQSDEEYEFRAVFEGSDERVTGDIERFETEAEDENGDDDWDDDDDSDDDDNDDNDDDDDDDDDDGGGIFS